MTMSPYEAVQAGFFDALTRILYIDSTVCISMCTCIWSTSANIFMYITFCCMLIEPTSHGNLDSFVEMICLSAVNVCGSLVSRQPTVRPATSARTAGWAVSGQLSLEIFERFSIACTLER